MMDFPAAPTLGQKYPEPAIAGLPVYVWDGEKWAPVTSASGSVTVVYVDTQDALRVAKAGDSMQGKLILQGGLNTGVGSGVGAGALEVQSTGTGAALITFHEVGNFACNFGLDGADFYYGGWSFGAGVYYKFISTRDSVVTGNRLVYVGDYPYGLNTGIVEPWGINPVTGGSGWDNSSFLYYFRHRQLQVLTPGGWIGVGE
jgi:hypothetical protein